MFRRSVEGVLSDDELRGVQDKLLDDPEAGAVIAGTGGARKLRAGLAGRGKRGGARVIYFHHEACSRVYLLLVYPKNVAANVSASGKGVLKATLDRIKSEGC